MHWPLVGRCFALQITTELKQYHQVGTLEDVRVIRDRKTGQYIYLYVGVLGQS